MYLQYLYYQVFSTYNILSYIKTMCCFDTICLSDFSYIIYTLQNFNSKYFAKYPFIYIFKKKYKK